MSYSHFFSPMVIDSGLGVTIGSWFTRQVEYTKDVNIMEIDVKSKYVPTFLIVPTYKAAYELVNTFEVEDDELYE